MIIGKTTEQKNDERNARNAELYARSLEGPRNHKRVFLFFPRILEDGRWAWLSFVTQYVQTVNGRNGWIDCKVYSAEDLS